MSRLCVRTEVRRPAFTLEAALDLPLAGIAAVFGPSGSGKSTLLRAIAGLEPRAAGRVEVAGEVWQDGDRGLFLPPHRRRVGLVFQDARLFPHLSVRGNLEFGLRRTARAERRLGFDRVVETLELGPLLARHPGGLSAGEAQRVAIGRAALASPRLLLMDEPLASLDEPRKQAILPFIERLPAALETPVLYVSHAIEEVSRLATTLVVLRGGKIAAVGSIQEVTSRLDLAPYTGGLDAGAVVRATVVDPEGPHGLTRLSFGGGELLVPGLDLPAGAEVNVRIRSRDVALALEPPRGTSILNILAGEVVEVAAGSGPHAHVLLDVGCRLWARVTIRSVEELGLEPGRRIHALIKAVAVDRGSLGRRTGLDV